MKTKTMRVRFAALAVSALMLLSGCAARSPVTQDVFKEKAEAAGFTVQVPEEGIDGMSGYAGASIQDTETQIVYGQYEDEADAMDTYRELKKSIPAQVNAKTAFVDSGSYNRYTVENGELYYVLVHLQDTLVYGTCKITDKAPVEQLLRDIKY